MQAELPGAAAPHRRGELTRALVAPLQRFPARLRDRRFWNIQAMVLAATAPHYIIESVGFTNPFETFHGLAITLYVIPLLYAALSFGWEGAILTALWVAVLTSPSMWVWHRSGYHWLTEVGQLAITLPAGLMVAWRVDLESKQRARAERTSAGLALLNEIGERLGHSIDIEDELPGVLRRLKQRLPADAAWLVLRRGDAPDESVILLEPADASISREPDVWHRDVASADAAVIEQGIVVVPVIEEGGIAGSIGVSTSDSQPSAEALQEVVRVLAAVAHEVGAAAQHARLYRERQESLQTYARQGVQAQEDERMRIARELHDETAQELVHLVRKLEQLGDSGARGSERIDELLEIARRTLQSVRRVSRNLRPSILDDLGLVPALELAVEETRSQLPDGARLAVTGGAHRLDRTIELALFRIAREALHNVERHAQARSAEVHLAFADDCVRLAVRDDGAGYSVPANVALLARRGKLGVLGMKERADLIGGTLEVHTEPGAGCEVIVTVPAAGSSTN